MLVSICLQVKFTESIHEIKCKYFSNKNYMFDLTIAVD
jgi:hypothetical protein